MNAKYYRFLYQPTAKGTIFSGSLGAMRGQDGYQLLYLCGGISRQVPDHGKERLISEHLDLLILGDLHPETVEYACSVLKESSVRTLMIPESPDNSCACRKFQESGAGEIREIADREEFSERQFRLRFLCVGEGNDRKLLFYIGGEHHPAEEECRMQIKTADASLPCSLAVNAADLSCEMRCMLRQDVTLCKRQNQKNGEYFVDGHFLPGTADLSDCMLQVREYLAEEWEKIRFISLPAENREKALREGLLGMGTNGHHRYFIGTADTDPQTLKAIAEDSPYGSFVCISEDGGLCISGCFMDRV